jgi:hypothetical protein
LDSVPQTSEVPAPDALFDVPVDVPIERNARQVAAPAEMDTAPLDGTGEAERIVGRAAGRRGGSAGRSERAKSSTSPRKRSKVGQIFIVSPARSGSTLLRYLLDSHPEITSPPELNLSALLQHVADVWMRTNEALGVAPETPTPEPPLSALTPDVCRRARKVVDELMVNCANEAGASIYCDKSLTTVDHLHVVSQCYPKASFIFLYRYPLDLIASGIEASRWGFNAFGFAPFLGAAPGNFIAGMGNYWIDRVTKMLEFERTCTVPHARIYYELLCDDPEGTLGELLPFLGLEADADLIERMFHSDHGLGPGDYKIPYTDSISPESIGRGSTLPQNLGPNQIERMNEMLAELDYPSLDAGWRGDLAALLGLKNTTTNGVTSAQVAKSLVKVLKAGSGNGAWPRDGLSSFEIVIKARGGDKVVLVDEKHGVSLAGRNGKRVQTAAAVRVRCVDDVLLGVASGRVNLAQAMHDGLVRIEAASETDRLAPKQTRELLELLQALLKGKVPG